MSRWGLFFVMMVFFLFGYRAVAQNISNEGTDFWAVFPTHVPSANNNVVSLAEISVFVTSRFQSEVTVSCGSYSQTLPIAPNTSVEFNIPRDEAYINANEANRLLSNRGIHVKVNDGMPAVSAYAHIYAGARSAASLILPFETMGQQYYSMNYTQNGVGDNFVVLMAVEDDTRIRVTPRIGTAFTINLANAGDVYQYMNADQDLTGTFLEIDSSTPCKKFAVFSGSTMIQIGDCPTPPNRSFDPLYQQLYPVNSWGKNYGVVPFIDRNYVLRIMAQADNTTVTFNGESHVISKGEFIETDKLTDGTYITADKLISVAQFSLTQSCSGAGGQEMIGDPEMVMLNPIEFNIKNITVFSSEKQRIDANSRYINVLIRGSAAPSFKINGSTPGVQWLPLPGNPMYVYAQIAVFAESLTLTASDGFNAIAYGFGDHESYAYSAGTNLSSNNYLTVVNKNNGNTESPNGCIDDELDFKITLPYLPDRLTWSLDGAAPILATATPIERIVNGDRVYIFSLPAAIRFPQVGEHRLEVTATVSSSAGNCISGNIVTGYVFNIYEHPKADFQEGLTGCIDNVVQFIDKSDSKAADFSIISWQWNFGDGSRISTLQNPEHVYTRTGSFDVKLSVKAGTSCASEVVVKRITIYALPEAKFTASTTTCVNTDLLFTDQSPPVANAAIEKWVWDFNDGKDPVEKTDALPFAYRFDSPGTYTIKLITYSVNGCASRPFHLTVRVTALPTADFEMPDFCLADGTAHFVNRSVDFDGSATNLTYIWRISPQGQSAPVIQYTSKDAIHRFTAIGHYDIALIVNTNNRCEVIKEQVFTVNGAVSKAEFSVKNQGIICAGEEVILNDLSEAAFGGITKVEIYPDVINKPGEFFTVTAPKGKDIPIQYESFGGNMVKTFRVRLVAYSGISCKETFEHDIAINPVPQLVFNELPSVCENEGSISVAIAEEISGMNQISGVYSGPYVSSSGMFNARNARPGIHAITYTFTGPYGCPVSLSRNITVFKTPQANAGSSVHILSGESVKINASGTMDPGTTYKWTPGAGLNRDDILNPIASPARDTKYMLTVSTADGCPSTSEVWIMVLQEIKPPNAFSPNGDGINDSWIIPYLTDYPNPTVEIFSRNGDKIFHSNGYRIPFDGNYKNLPLPVGIYYYIISPKSGRKSITGPLTIIR